MGNIFDMFFTNLFEANLNVKNFAKETIYYTSTKSTSDDIWELYNETGQTNKLIITDNQTSGRGRKNNKWIAQPNKSLTFSFILKDIFNINDINLYSILIPVSIINGIRNFSNISLELKWPNDIMYENKKVGGVLIESKLNNEKSIFNIGIGINVNESKFDFPDTLKDNINSLKEIKGTPIQREPLLASILNELDRLINNLDRKELINYWIKSCNHINKEVSFIFENKNITGVFMGINDLGEALIKHNDKVIEYSNPIETI
tara:strand:- start:414 stop:1196 length:783 start_codon:yes stop_codon:yes gene_type:complete